MDWFSYAGVPFIQDEDKTNRSIGLGMYPVDDDVAHITEQLNSKMSNS